MEIQAKKKLQNEVSNAIDSNYSNIFLDSLDGHLKSKDHLGNVNPVGINSDSILTSWMTRYTGVKTVTQVISTTEVDLTAYFGTLTQQIKGDTPLFYDSVNNVFKCDPLTNVFYSFRAILRINGTISGGTGTESVYEIRFKRPPGSLNSTIGLPKQQFNKPAGSSNTLTDEIICDIPTRVFDGATDPFQTEGFRIAMIRITGNDLTLSAASQNLFFER